jgi:hypothetical protein
MRTSWYARAMMQTAVGLDLAVSAAVFACVVLPACSNSVLRNAAEAGLETVLEEPLPTPTATVRDQSGAAQQR